MWKSSTVSRQMLQILANTVVAICPVQSALPPMSSTWDSSRIRLYLTPVSSPRILPCLKVSILSISRRFETHYLYRATENTANQNTRKPLYIRRYDVQPWLCWPPYFLCNALSWYTVEYRDSCKYREKIQVTRGIFHGTTLESIAVNSVVLTISISWVPEDFLAHGGRKYSAEAPAGRHERRGHSTDMIETGNRARKTSGTQDIIFRISQLFNQWKCHTCFVLLFNSFWGKVQVIRK